MKPIFLSLSIFVASLNITYGQLLSMKPQLLVDSAIEKWDYHSTTVNEDYTLYISTPEGYDTSTSNYPVLYVTDGDWSVSSANTCFSLLDMDYRITQPIVVGIGYGQRPNKRGKDLDPDTGGPNFLAFIEKELIPFINSKYRTTEDRALYGYSMGGLFTTWVLFDHPGLFNTIFIGAPGNNGRKLVTSAKKYFAGHHDLKANVFIGVGSLETETAGNVKRFGFYLQQQHCKSLVVQSAIIPGLGHGAGVGPVMQSAIKFAYCKLHKSIRLTTEELKQYAGTYTTSEAAGVKFKIYTDKGQLYFNQEGSGNLPAQLVPFARNRFFEYQNEKGEFSFNNDGGKKYMLFTTPNEAPHRLNKIR